ncbi:MAG: response regulator transcription factor, partial [Lachnospiraceae bacterium]|nr:response regulator transcription factor [Lachnospiraceae bacterium]
MHTSVFIIDDEAELAQYTAKYFNMSGVKTEYALDAESALEWLEENTVSLILLDINLGEHSGFDLCQKLRKETDVPILFISARSSEDDMMLALNIGGDDYVCKPYSLGVLLAKVKAILKRYEQATANRVGSEAGQGVAQPSAQDALQSDSLVHFGNVTVDMNSAMVKNANGGERLKAMEYKVLAYLLKNK